MKKQSKDWYIAATHWATAGFAIPFIIGLIIGLPLILLLGEENSALWETVMAILWIPSIWLGIIYSGRYIEKTYIIRDNKKIVKLATIYFVAITFVYKLWIWSQQEISIDLISDLLFFIIAIFVYYVISKKYIKNNEVVI